jgi:hypothetical protein
VLELEDEVARLREALDDLVDGAAVTFEDERVPYEDVQLSRGALARARAALRGECRHGGRQAGETPCPDCAALRGGGE